MHHINDAAMMWTRYSDRMILFMDLKYRVRYVTRRALVQFPLSSEMYMIVSGRFGTDESTPRISSTVLPVMLLAIRPSETAQIAHREVCVCEDPCNNCRQRAAVTINSMADGDSDAFELMCNASIVVVQGQ